MWGDERQEILMGLEKEGDHPFHIEQYHEHQQIQTNQLKRN